MGFKNSIETLPNFWINLFEMLTRYSKFSLNVQNLKNIRFQHFWVKYLPRIGHDSRFSALSCFKRLDFAQKLLGFEWNFLKRSMLETIWMILNALWTLEIFWCSKCSTIFLLQITQIENSNSKLMLEIAGLEKFNAWNATDRSICHSESVLIQSHFWFGFLWFEIVNWLQK